MEIKDLSKLRREKLFAYFNNGYRLFNEKWDVTRIATTDMGVGIDIDEVISSVGELESRYKYLDDTIKAVNTGFIMFLAKVSTNSDRVKIYEKMKVVKKLFKNNSNNCKSLVTYMTYLNDYYDVGAEQIDELNYTEQSRFSIILPSVIYIFNNFIYSVLNYDEDTSCLVAYDSVSYRLIYRKDPPASSLYPKVSTSCILPASLLFPYFFDEKIAESVHNSLRKNGLQSTEPDFIDTLYVYDSYISQLRESWFLLTENDEDFYPELTTSLAEKEVTAELAKYESVLDTVGIQAGIVASSCPDIVNRDLIVLKNVVFAFRKYIIPKSGFIMNIETNRFLISKIYMRELHNFELDNHYIILKLFVNGKSYTSIFNFGGNLISHMPLDMHTRNMLRILIAYLLGVFESDRMKAEPEPEHSMFSDLKYNIEIPYSWRDPSDYRNTSMEDHVRMGNYRYELRDIAVYTRTLPEGSFASQEIKNEARKYRIVLKEGQTLVRPHLRQQRLNKI
ncbi:MAG: hypothetical protein P4L69_15535 [Desulfosporosinus sp.]|nr:hypothetical protein [Desulfosporosinus sp.]